jgi:hypothetical protein
VGLFSRSYLRLSKIVFLRRKRLAGDSVRLNDGSSRTFRICKLCTRKNLVELSPHSHRIHV